MLFICVYYSINSCISFSFAVHLFRQLLRKLRLRPRVPAVLRVLIGSFAGSTGRTICAILARLAVLTVDRRYRYEFTICIAYI